MVLQKRFDFIEDDAIGEAPEWMKKMSTHGQDVDQLFIQLCSEVLQRKIILLPVNYEDGHRDGKIEIFPRRKSRYTDVEPFYLLYYSESSFFNGHFQSIRPQQSFQEALIETNLVSSYQRPTSPDEHISVSSGSIGMSNDQDTICVG